MKFLLRCLLVLAVAGIFGAVLYYAVQLLPGASPNPQPGIRLQPERSRGEADRSVTQTERPENNRPGGIRLRSLLQVARRVLVFSVLVLVSVFVKNLVFERRLNKK